MSNEGFSETRFQDNGEGDDALAMSHRPHLRKCVEPPFFPEHRHKSGEAVRNIYRKIKKNIHKPLSPASVDKSVHKFAPPSKYSTFLYLHEVNA